MYIHLHTFRYIYMHLNTSIYIHLHTLSYAYVHSHVHTYMYTEINTYQKDRRTDRPRMEHTMRELEIRRRAPNTQKKQHVIDI